SDPAGDATTRVDPDTGATTTIPNEPRADIVSASASYASGSIVLSVRTAQPVDLRTANIDADNTTMQWAIDVNNDGKSDYQVEYGVDTGKLYAEVYLPNATTKSCTGTASIAADGSYVSSVPLNCLGNPQSFRWGGLMQFTATGTPPAPTDRVPDAGYLGPISAAAPTPPPP